MIEDGSTMLVDTEVIRDYTLISDITRLYSCLMSLSGTVQNEKEFVINAFFTDIKQSNTKV